MVAPGTALREGIDNILHARTGGLIVIGDPDELAFLFSGGIKLDLDYSPALLYELAKMDGAIVLSSNATKIVHVNVQLTPDPTILTFETGTRHRTAERVSKQTDALVVAISERREVVSLYVDGIKYILEDIPVVLAKANQALATLDKYRSRLDQVSTRLTALEFEGGATLHDVLTVLQRAELVTRMAVEIERYIVELGTEGRLIEMQLDETMVGVSADKAALVHDYLIEDTRRDVRDGVRPARAPPQSGPLGLRSPRRAARLRPQAEHPRLPDLSARFPDPGADPSPAQDGRAADRGGVRRARGVARRYRWRAGDRRRSRRDPGEGHPRGSSPTAGDQPGRQVPANVVAKGEGRARVLAPRPSRKEEDTITELMEEQLEDLEIVEEVVHIEFEIGDNVVYPHHGAGKVIRKEQKEVLGERREYLTIKILHNDMTVMVPTENAALAGLRRVIDEETVQKVLGVLQDECSEMPKNWNRRFKYNRDKIKTGDIYELAEVVRNLAIREAEKGLSTGEKQMFTRAKKILASELMYALEMDEDGVEEHLQGLLLESYHGKNGKNGKVTVAAK